MTDTATRLPIEQCDLTVSVGRDVVWLHFGKNAAVHVHNTLGQGGGICATQINNWCLDRQAQAVPRPSPGEN